MVVAIALALTQAMAGGPTDAPSAVRASAHQPPAKVRARDLGVPFEGTPGTYNAITDIPGVEVGFTTLISGDPAAPFVEGHGPVRTGVTAILPRGKHSKDPVFAGFFSQNGNGEMTGSEWVQEGGFLEGPVMITNTHSVGVVRDAVIAWEVKHQAEQEPARRCRVSLVAARRGRDVRRWAQRRERVSRAPGGRIPRARRRVEWTRCGGERRRRDRDAVLWLQGGDGHGIARPACGARWVHRWGSRAVQHGVS